MWCNNFSLCLADFIFFLFNFIKQEKQNNFHKTFKKRKENEQKEQNFFFAPFFILWTKQTHLKVDSIFEAALLTSYLKVICDLVSLTDCSPLFHIMSP